MKKNVIDFTTKAGNEYKITRPTADQRADIYSALKQDKDGTILDGFKFALSVVRMTCKDANPDEMTDIDIGEIANRAFELASLGK